jgi:di/tricarboxylate transporter
MTALPQGLLNTRVYSGDVILVQGGREQLAGIRREGRLLMLDATADLPFTRRAPMAIAILIGVVAAAATGIAPIAISAMLGVLLMLATHTLGWRDVGNALSVSVIMVIVASVALAYALQVTGGADFLAMAFLSVAENLPPAMILSLLMLLVGALTNVVSNNAAAIVGTPIAASIASELQAPVEPFVLAVLFGANLSFVTPMAYQTNLLVMNAGGYVFSDFVRVGAPLFLIVWLTLSLLLPMLYGF